MRFLGVYLDPKLSGDRHMDHIIAKGKRVSAVLSMLRGTWWGANPCLLLNIYSAMIRASFEYASLIFALKRNQSIIKLQRIQNQAIRLACGYRIYTPINVMHAETKLPLLKLRFELLAARYFIRILSIQEHPVTNILLDLFISLSNPGFNHYLNKNFPAALVFFRMWSHRNTLHTTPALPAYQNSFTSTVENADFLSLPKAILNNLDDLPKHAVQLVFEEHFQTQLHNANVFYTDGSKVDDNTYVGSAVFSPQLNLEYMCKLSPYASIFTAEAWAIYNAMLFILHNGLKRAVIVSDFKSVLETLKGFRNKTNNYIVCYIRALIEEAKFNNSHITFIWIPSHRGIKGNETADELAKKAIREGIDSNFKVPYSDLYIIPKRQLDRNFEDYLKQSSNHKGEFYFKNCYSQETKKPWFYDARLSRMLITTMNRLRSNHYNLNHSLYRKNLIDDPSCPCGAPLQDLVHFVFHCPLTESHASPLRTALQELILEPTIDPYSSIILALNAASPKLYRLFASFGLANDRRL
ncbi:PREDICTED: uncharacterized protein LOC108779613 [Cyphomyrmex costatus]|uniref:Gag-Pol polyprotein n=1 Tax=Cyphomyrmex costatus TaxID=456900 RepID=A0A151IAE2_9HYME|nr:PREDICTED: uncharacterized protein LOC108779613 [Cyphomyrmex costatus]KYM96273.1 Gag-Pol polyprotein [Cyphomyrmex costatus]